PLRSEKEHLGVNPRLLFVDDEPSIRITLPAILEQQGFQVTAAATVPEALALITAEKYDILIADLNIGQPGDGFTVVSAMRRTQPEAVTFILTGYPAFESALRAIREQVDDFFTKPTDVSDLVTALRRALATRIRHEPMTTKRLRQIIQENKLNIIDEWLRAVEEKPAIAAVPLAREERLNHLPEVMDELLRARTTDDDAPSPEALNAAEKHGVRRREQKYTIPMVLEEGRILHHVISDCMRRNLLVVDISNLISDLNEVNDKIHCLVQESVRAYLAASLEPKAA
ncbi:MAG TPA: response regulator, partial [Terriglobales bacterium]|nr:response regulator [Terriglobales bacterium]